MPRPILATAYLKDGGNPNRSYPTYPGGRIDFRGNLACIVDERDMVPVLRMPNVVVHISPERVDWAQAWIDSCGLQPAKAEVVVPPRPEEIARAEGEGMPPIEETMRTVWEKPHGVMGHKPDCECLFCDRVRRKHSYEQDPVSSGS